MGYRGVALENSVPDVAVLHLSSPKSVGLQQVDKDKFVFVPQGVRHLGNARLLLIGWYQQCCQLASDWLTPAILPAHFRILPAAFWLADTCNIASSIRTKSNAQLSRKYFAKHIPQCLPRNVSKPRKPRFRRVIMSVSVLGWFRAPCYTPNPSVQRGSSVVNHWKCALETLLIIINHFPPCKLERVWSSQPDSLAMVNTKHRKVLLLIFLRYTWKFAQSRVIFWMNEWKLIDGARQFPKIIMYVHSASCPHKLKIQRH